MENLTLFQQLQKLPLPLQQEVADFVGYLSAKYLPSEAAPEAIKRPSDSMKGLVVYMSEDFDAPLDDFKDYMP